MGKENNKQMHDREVEHQMLEAKIQRILAEYNTDEEKTDQIKTSSNEENFEATSEFEMANTKTSLDSGFSDDVILDDNSVQYDNSGDDLDQYSPPDDDYVDYEEETEYYKESNAKKLNTVLIVLLVVGLLILSVLGTHVITKFTYDIHGVKTENDLRSVENQLQVVIKERDEAMRSRDEYANKVSEQTDTINDNKDTIHNLEMELEKYKAELQISQMIIEQNEKDLKDLAYLKELYNEQDWGK